MKLLYFVSSSHFGDQWSTDNVLETNLIAESTDILKEYGLTSSLFVVNSIHPLHDGNSLSWEIKEESLLTYVQAHLKVALIIKMFFLS